MSAFVLVAQWHTLVFSGIPYRLLTIIMAIWLTIRISDLNLVKEKILKLDSLGNEASNKGNRDHLADLLALRNK